VHVCDVTIITRSKHPSPVALNRGLQNSGRGCLLINILFELIT